MGTKRVTIKVKALSKGKNKVYAVYRNNPNGTEWRIPHTDTRDRSVAVKRAKIHREKLRAKR